MKGPQVTLAVPLTFTYGAIYSGFSCLDLDPLWVLRKQRDRDTSRGDTSRQMPFEDIRDSSVHRSHRVSRGCPLAILLFVATEQGRPPPANRAVGACPPSLRTPLHAEQPSPDHLQTHVSYVSVNYPPALWNTLSLPPGQPRGTEVLSPCVQSQCSWCEIPPDPHLSDQSYAC